MATAFTTTVEDKQELTGNQLPRLFRLRLTCFSFFEGKADALQKDEGGEEEEEEVGGRVGTGREERRQGESNREWEMADNER